MPPTYEDNQYRRKVMKLTDLPDMVASAFASADSKRNPQFYIDNPEELTAMLRQRSQASFAGFDDRLRETLADAGLLQSGAFGTGLANARVAMGQQQLGDIAGVYQDELNRKRQFDISRALQLMEQDHQMKIQQQAQEFNWNQAIGGVLGLGGQALGGFLARPKPRSYGSGSDPYARPY
jgi:hypothetical protein